MWCEPAQIRPLALKQSRNGFDQHWKRGTLSDATRGTQGQDPLHPALALLALSPLAAFVPPDAASMDARRDVLCRFSTLDIHNAHSDAPSRAKRWAHVPALSSRVASWLTSQWQRAYHYGHRKPVIPWQAPQACLASPSRATLPRACARGAGGHTPCLRTRATPGVDLTRFPPLRCEVAPVPGRPSPLQRWARLWRESGPSPPCGGSVRSGVGGDGGGSGQSPAIRRTHPPAGRP